MMESIEFHQTRVNLHLEVGFFLLNICKLMPEAWCSAMGAQSRKECLIHYKILKKTLLNTCHFHMELGGLLGQTSAVIPIQRLFLSARRPP